jgi:octaprenyl-diphosphate synthase
MGLSIKEIQAPVLKEMSEFEQKFRQSVKTNVMLLDQIMKYIVHRKGKQMRPMLVFLTAGSLGEINDATYRGASMIELLHTASLVHDDVVDDSNYRRSFFSIKALWKNKIAVLVGDFMLSRGLLLSVDNGDFGFLKIMSETVKVMSEGELLQIEKARRLDITEDIYFEVIRQKTAALISSCCSIGAMSVGKDEATIQKAAILGEKIGMAFQIKDDLFDYGASEIGKPTGIDIKEKKMTLPLIFALNQASRGERKKYINIVKNESNKPAKVQEVIDFVIKSGGIAYTKNAMMRYVEEAMAILQTFAPSKYRDSLEGLITYNIERTK